MSEPFVIVGGGAAGFFAALSYRENGGKCPVVLLEATERTLAKVRISGGGRCNVTHHCFEPSLLCRNYPRGEKELRGPFSRFQPQDTVRWFAARGVELKTEDDGRIFPITDSSETIAGTLEREAKIRGVEIRLKHKVQRVGFDPSVGKLSLDTSRGELPASGVVFASGGSRTGMEILSALGHTIVSPVPSLFTFKIVHPLLSELAGTSFPNAELRILEAKLSTRGAVLITHWGLSGPATLKLSAAAARVLYERRYEMPLQVNWIGMPFEDCVAELFAVQAEHPKRQVGNDPRFQLTTRFWRRAVEHAEIDPTRTWQEVGKAAVRKLCGVLTTSVLQIQGKGEFKEEFVTAGGVSRKEIDWRTMESRIVPNLYLAGEIIDIDGFTGGFNFQAAWTTGWIAGQAAALKC